MNQYVPIELDKVRNLRYGLKAFAIIEDLMDTPFTSINYDNLKITELATFIYAGLVHEDKELTVDKVLDLIDEHSNLEEVSQKMAKALTASFGSPKDSKIDTKVIKKK